MNVLYFCINMKGLRTHKGQVILEFCLCMFIILLMIYALIEILRWTGLDLYSRRKAHENNLRKAISEDYSASAPTHGPLKQISPYFYSSRDMHAVWSGAY